MKIKSSGTGTMVLMEDGTMYATGKNIQGELGIRQKWGVRDDKMNNVFK